MICTSCLSVRQHYPVAEYSDGKTRLISQWLACHIRNHILSEIPEDSAI